MGYYDPITPEFFMPAKPAWGRHSYNLPLAQDIVWLQFITAGVCFVGLGRWIWTNTPLGNCFIQLINFIVMNMSVLLPCIYVHPVQAWCPWRSEDAVRYTETGVMDGCRLHHVCWKFNPGHLWEQHTLLTIEPLPSPRWLSFSSESFPLPSKFNSCLLNSFLFLQDRAFNG